MFIDLYLVLSRALLAMVSSTVDYSDELIRKVSRWSCLLCTVSSASLSHKIVCTLNGSKFSRWFSFGRLSERFLCFAYLICRLLNLMTFVCVQLGEFKKNLPITSMCAVLVWLLLCVCCRYKLNSSTSVHPHLADWDTRYVTTWVAFNVWFTLNLIVLALAFS